MEEETGEVVQLLYGDEKVDQRIEWFPGGMQSGTHDQSGKSKGLRFSPKPLVFTWRSERVGPRMG